MAQFISQLTNLIINALTYVIHTLYTIVLFLAMLPKTAQFLFGLFMYLPLYARIGIAVCVAYAFVVAIIHLGE